MAESWTDLGAVELTAHIRRREVTASAVLEAFIKKIEEVNPRLNALVIDCFDSAREGAAEIDRGLATGATAENRPMLGLPVTIKEMFDLAGTPTTVGLAHRKTKRATRDSVTVARLKNAGAIVLGKTNVPQLGMIPEADNPVYGRTNNPHDVERTCGGSSGGDAALIAAGGSPLSLASDGAGSIRLPAHFCGVMGFKPTGGRISMDGHWLSTNWPADWAQPGPMARRVEDLRLGYEVLRGRSDQRVFGELDVPTPDSTHRNRNRVGVFDGLSILPAGPTARRSAALLSQRLADQGVDVVPVQLDRAEEYWNLFLAIFYAEALADMRRQAKGQRLDWRVRQAFLNAKLPGAIRPIVGWIAARLGQKRVSELMQTLNRPMRTSAEYCRLLARLAGLRRSFARWMDRKELDYLAGPVGPGPAFPHGDFYASFALGYTGIFNVLGMPAGAVPITSVTAEDTRMWAEELGTPRDWCEQSLVKANRGSEGLPFGVQVVGRWWDEAGLLDLMSKLELKDSCK